MNNNAITIQKLSKYYKDFQIENFNLELPSGSIMGLIGENGAGKTTLIKLILNMIRKDNGTITILGKDSQKELTSVKDDIGVVLDEPCIPEYLKAKEINKIMKNIFTHWNEKTFFGYLQKLKVPENKTFKEFSKGMKMKLGLAIALSHNPKLLILDEATNGLDPVMRDEVNDIFMEFTREETHSILVSSHIVSDLDKICDYIAFMHNGQLLICDEKDLLMEKYGVINCTKDELKNINTSAIVGKKKTPYGINVLMERRNIPQGLKVSAVDVEDLFIFMVKED